MLRPGNASAHLGFEPVLRRLLPRIRKAFPKARILVRLDGEFAAPEVLDFLDREQVQDGIGMATTQPLAEEAADAMACARAEAKRNGESARAFGDLMHETEKTWPYERRVVYKAEVVCCTDRPARDNLRFVVTNLSNALSRVYEIYRKRGEMENRIKELKCGLEMDRTSCSSGSVFLCVSWHASQTTRNWDRNPSAMELSLLLGTLASTPTGPSDSG